MSLVETLHREHLERKIRFLQAALKHEHKATKVYDAPNIPPPKAREPVKRREYTPKLPAGADPRIDKIQRIVCEHYGIAMTDLLSARRTKDIVFPRQVAAYLCVHLTKKSYPEIGRRFGNRDHTTILHAARKITRDLERDDRLQASVDMLKDIIGAEPVERHGPSVLREDDVRAIRASTDRPEVLAERYGITRSAIWWVIQRKTWRNVE